LHWFRGFQHFSGASAWPAGSSASVSLWFEAKAGYAFENCGLSGFTCLARLSGSEGSRCCVFLLSMHIRLFAMHHHMVWSFGRWGVFWHRGPCIYVQYIIIRERCFALLHSVCIFGSELLRLASSLG
jgi:hypothetical protein